MKKKKLLLFIPLIAILLSGLFLLKNENSSAQSNKINFERAAKENNKLQYSLRWTFGRKVQRGWYLYVPLIQHTIKNDAEPQTAEFAKAIFDWQKSRRLLANGIINQRTLYAFIKHWQSKRIRPIRLAKENELLTAPISNFYDPTRAIELLKVEKVAFDAYKQMVAAAIADKSLGLKIDKNSNLSKEEQFLKLISTYRSPAYQASLRKKEPGASRAQIAFRSPHFTGRALDIYVGGEPVMTKDFNRAIQIKTPVYKWLVKNAEKFGFYPYFYEPWHWEYVPKNVSAK